MSRLDSFIRRLQAQRACLDMAAAASAALDGPILEIGLGNGRTYDHLREICPDREIFVFEREVRAHPACIPDPEHLILGDLRDTLPAARARFPGSAALIHIDIGSGDEAASRAIAAVIASHLPGLLRADGLVVSDQDVAFPGGTPLDPPDGVRPGRYHLYRKTGSE